VRPDGQWHQANVTFTDPHDAEQLAATRIAPVLRAAEDNGDIDSWWFVRKQQWRFRYRTTEHAQAGAILPVLATPGPWSWTAGIYEPEVHAFGGPAGMDTAHALFHHDSRHVLGGTHRRSDRQELTILLLTAMMRAAEQWVIARGMPKLQLMVRADNAAAIGFYHAIGYQTETSALLSWRFDGR